MGDATVTAFTSVVPVQSRFLTAGQAYKVLLSSCSDVGHLVTVRDMDGFLSTPQSIVISTLSGITLQSNPALSSLRLEQSFGYVTLRATSPSNWLIVDIAAFSTAGADYDLRGVSYSTLNILDQALVVSSISTAGPVTAVGLNATSTLEFEGPLFASTFGVRNDATTPLNTNLYITGATYIQGNVLAAGPSVSTTGNLTVGGPTRFIEAVSNLSSVTVQQGLFVSAATSVPFTVLAPVSTSYTTTVFGSLSTGGALTVSTNAQVAQTVTALQTAVRLTSARTVRATDGIALSAATVAATVRPRSDITVVDPTYTGPTNPIVQVQQGLAAPSIRAAGLTATAWTAQTLIVTNRISSVGAAALQFSSASIVNPAGSLTTSSIQTGSLAANAILGPGGSPPTEFSTGSVTASTLYLQYELVAPTGSLTIPSTLVASANVLTGTVSTLQTGGVQLLLNSVETSTLTLSSALVGPAVSSVSIPGAQITAAAVATSSLRAAVIPGTLQVQTLTTPFSYLTLAAPATFSTVTASSVTSLTTTTSSLTTTTVTLGAPLDYSTIGPTGPFATTSTASGLSSNTPYEYISGLGTIYNPLLIKAANSRTVNITLNNCSTVSTAYFNALFTYRNDGNATGSAGLRIVNSFGTSTILSFNANPITTIQTASLSNYPIDFNPFAGASTFYLVGPSTLQAPSTLQNNSPLVAGGSAGQVRLAFNDDGLLQSWSTVGTQTTPFASTNSIVWNGTLWVAAGTTTNSLAYSYNGYEWYGLGTSIFTNGATDLAWNGVRWVATGSGLNTLAVSPDGVTWTGLGTSIFTARGRCVAWNGTQFVAGGEGTHTLAYSYDGSNWTGIGSTIFTSAALDVAWGSNRWVAVGAGTTKLATSRNGITWTTTATALGQEGEAVAWNGSVWLAGGGRGTSNTLARSADGGATWSNINLSNVLPIVYDITYNDGLWVAAGQRGTATFATSVDNGLTWSGTEIAGASTLSTATAVSGRQTLPYGLSTTDLVLTAGSGGPSSLAYSQDGSTWATANPFSSVTAVTKFAYNGRDQWLATGILGTEAVYNNITTAFNWDTVSSLCTVRTSTTAARITLGNAYAYSVEAFSTPFQVSYRLGTTGVNRIIGGFSATKNLTENDLRYAFYTSDGGNANNILENGAFPAGMSSYIVTTSTVFQLTYDGTNIKYWADGGLIRTTTPSSISTFFMGFHFKEPSSAITSVTFGPYYATQFPLYQSPNGGISWTGNSNVPLGYGAGVATNGFRWIATGHSSRGNTIVTSLNGSNWTGLGSNVFATVGRGVAWGSNLWVATGEGGTNTLAYSYDGLSWTGLGSTLTTSGRAVATNGSNRWVAGGALPNTLLTSADGITWTGLGSTIFDGTANDIAWNGSLWVAAGQGSQNTLATSLDGVTWTGQGRSTFISSANAVTWDTDAWTVTGETGASSFHTFRSADGSNWTPANSTAFTVGTAAAARRLLPGPSTAYESAVIAVGVSPDTQAQASLGGSNYLAIPNSFSTFTQGLYAVAWNGSVWVAGGQAATVSPYKVLFASYDGLQWSTISLANVTFIQAIAYGKGLWIAGGVPSGSYSWATSSDGFNWTEQSSNIFSNSVVSLAWGGNVWVAGGATAAEGLRWSGNGLNWSNVSLTPGSPSGFFAGYGVATNGSLWVAVGDFAGIGWSQTGSTWTFLATPAPFTQGTAVAYGNGRWVATGIPGGSQSNAFALSLDGSNWTGVGGSNIFNQRATGVTWNGEAFIATGWGTSNSLAISVDGSNWTGLGNQQFTGVGTTRGSAVAARRILPNHEPEPPGTTTLPYRTFTWSVTANMTVVSQTSVQKTGATAAWDARAASAEGYTTAAALSFQAGQTTALLAVGLSENPTSTTSFTALNFSFRLTTSGGLEIWELGSLVTSAGSYLTTDVLKITYDGVRVRYYKNATILRTVVRAVGAALYLSSSFYTQNGAITTVAFEPLYQLVTTQPPLATTGYLVNSNAGTDLLQSNPFYLTLASNLAAGQWTVNVTLDGTISTATSFVGDFYYNSTLITSTNAITPAYSTGVSTYTLSFSLNSTFAYTAGDTASLQFRATRSAGNSYLYTNYNNLAATDPRSSAVTVGTVNSNAIEYLQFFHTSATALQTSELDFRLSHTSTNTATYFDSGAGVLMNQGLLRWTSSLNTQTVQNRYNDISTRSLTYTNALLNASDPALKEDIETAPLDEYQSIVRSLPLYRYEFVESYRSALMLDDRHQLGILATELHTRSPDMITEVPTELCGLSSLYTVNRQQLRLAHLGATKRLMERVSSLQARIAALAA